MPSKSRGDAPAPSLAARPAAPASKPAKAARKRKSAAPAGSGSSPGKEGRRAGAPRNGAAAKKVAIPVSAEAATPAPPTKGRKRPAKIVTDSMIEVRRIHRRDLNRTWEFLKISFRDVNTETVEYQRPRSKKRFVEIYEEEGVEQLLFEVDGEIVAYSECAFEVLGSDNWINPRYFENRDMRPLFVEELAVHPDWHGRGVGGFVMEQLHHLAKVRGLTHLVLEVAENNDNALQWYRKRGFRKLDAAIFMAVSVDTEPELLPPRELPTKREPESSDGGKPEPEPA